MISFNEAELKMKTFLARQEEKAIKLDSFKDLPNIKIGDREIKATKKILFIVLLLVMGCAQQNNSNVGDIPFDKAIDDADFKVCNERKVKQYYVRGSSDDPPNYKGEKRGLENAILNKYRYPQAEKENGYVTIRFIVNCEGKTGRFRIEEMDFAYKAQKFDKGITDQLLEIVQDLNDWVPRKSNGENVDFYQYLTFKIDKGQIVKILP